MIDVTETMPLFQKYELEFFTGVPDSLLKPLCEIFQKMNNITAANEGNSVALAAGYYLTTGKIPTVYMQNSGLGNIVNPLLSLSDEKVYKIPAFYIIGWRGEPNKADEPQHITQGELSEELLQTLKMKYKTLKEEHTIEDFSNILAEAQKYMLEQSKPYALLVQKGAFISNNLQKDTITSEENLPLREEVIETIIDSVPVDSVIVSTTGKSSRELYEIRERRGESHEKDFLTVGSMGHSSQIALMIAKNQPKKQVYCIDGEGAMMMHMGAMVVNGQLAGKNFAHIVINNGAHDSVGGQINYGKEINFRNIAIECGYHTAYRLSDLEKLREILGEHNQNGEGSLFIQVDVRMGSRENLGRPKLKPIENKELIMEFLKK